jgi:peptidyl-prolyl cis-trans isomerase D
MATLQNIRNRGPLLVIVIGVALLAFVLGDLFSSGSMLMGKARDRAFVVNGEVITTQQYSEKITEFEEFQKMISGQSSLDENTSLQIREAVYQQMIRNRLIEDQANDLGIVVSKEEINDLVHGESISPILQQLPFFVDPQTGTFSRMALIEFLNVINTASTDPQEQQLVNQYKSIWLFIENMITTQRLEEKYISLLSNSVIANDFEAKTSFDLSQQNSELGYVMQSYFTIPDSAVTVTDKEIKSFYEKHKKSYKTETPLVKISYFTTPIKPSDEDFAEIKQQSETAFAQLQISSTPATVVADYSDTPFRDVFLGENMLTPTQLDFARNAAIDGMYGPAREGDSFQIYKLIDKTVAPDSVYLSMMAVPNSTVVGQDSIITNFVDSIYNLIQGGESFALVANSLNPNSNGGDVGWAREIDLLPFGINMVKEAFSVPIGQPIKVSVPGQEIIFQIEKRTSPVNKYKLAVVNMPVVPSEKTSNNIDNNLNQLVSTPDIGKKFNELASEAGYMVMPSMTFSSNDFSLGQIPGSRQVITWAANEKEVGAVRKFDLTNLRVVARVDQQIPAGTTPLSEVSESIKSRLINEKKAEMIIADLRQKNLSSLEDYAETMNSIVDTVRFVNFTTQNITGIGYEPVINSVASFAPIGKTIGPMQGNLGVFVANVTNRTEGTAEYDEEIQKTTILNNNAYRIQTQAIETLKDELGVVDNRYRFF